MAMENRSPSTTQNLRISQKDSQAAYERATGKTGTDRGDGGTA